MSLSLQTKIMVWSRAAQRCSLPSCRKELVVSGTAMDDPSLVGEICHIVAEKDDGPWGQSSLTLIERNQFGNLILLCCTHHKLVDDQINLYSVEKLKRIKSEHEAWVQSNLSLRDPILEHDRQVFAQYIDEWSSLCKFDSWDNWTGEVLASGGKPSLLDGDLRRLQDLRDWLFCRVWPDRYLPLKKSFQCFQGVLIDFLNVFRSEMETKGNRVRVREFYKIDEWNSKRYDELVKKFEAHVALVEDLLLELTRAANYVCDKVRECIEPTFRMEEGVIIVTTGPFSNLELVQVRAEYKESERISIPYPGLKEFKIKRFERNYTLGHPEDNVHLR